MSSGFSRAAICMLGGVIGIGAFVLSACSGGGGTVPSAGRDALRTATSTAPSIAWSPSPYDFGTLHGGDPAVSQTFTLKNTGGSGTSALKIALTITAPSPAPSPPAFAITSDTCTGTSLGKGKTCTVTVTYSFTSAGENDAATLKAVSNKPTATAQDLLTGKSAVHSQTFNLTGAVQHFTVPSGVTQITVDAVGASGGQSFGFPGGLGYEVKATLAVNPLDVLDVYVGGSGAEAGPGGCTGGFNGGANPTCPFGSTGAGGGGASDVRPNGGALADRIIVAGGGGGGQNATPSGGNAGYLSGADGQHDPTITYTIVDATGGTQTAGGAAGTSSPGFNGQPGSFGNGGAGDTNGAGQDPGSGGGGGWYGGGGGAASGSGAGGSSHLAAAATHVSDNQATSGECDAGNNGCITISW